MCGIGCSRFGKVAVVQRLHYDGLKEWSSETTLY